MKSLMRIANLVGILLMLAIILAFCWYGSIIPMGLIGQAPFTFMQKVAGDNYQIYVWLIYAYRVLLAIGLLLILLWAGNTRQQLMEDACRNALEKK